MNMSVYVCLVNIIIEPMNRGESLIMANIVHKQYSAFALVANRISIYLSQSREV